MWAVRRATLARAALLASIAAGAMRRADAMSRAVGARLYRRGNLASRKTLKGRAEVRYTMRRPSARAAGCVVLAALLGVGCLYGPVQLRRRRLSTVNGYDLLDLSWFTGEDHTTRNGVVPSMTCPVGKYRPVSSTDSNYQRLVSLRTEGCRDCPRGKYGSVAGLQTDSCSAECPLGRYRDLPGGKSKEDCHPCPPGVYGQQQGLTTKHCSGKCPAGKYSRVWGLDDPQECEDCPTGHRGWQCEWPITAQHFSGDRVHHYDLDSNPADKLRGEPVAFERETEDDVDPDRPLDLTTPFKYPLRNEITDTFGNT